MFVFPRTAVWIQHEGAQAFVADPNVVTFYNPGQCYTRQPLSPVGDYADWYQVASPVVCEAIAAIDPSTDDRPHAPIPWARGPSGARVYLRQRVLFQHLAGATATDPLLVEECVFELLAAVVRAGFRVQPPPVAANGRRPARQREVVEAVKARLALAFHRRWGLRDLARVVGSSPYHLARVFHRHTGSTLHEYQVRLRLKAALERLVDPSTDLLSLALDLGFSSHSHFTTSFRQRFGMTPSQVRARTTAAGARQLLAEIAPG